MDLGERCKLAPQARGSSVMHPIRNYSISDLQQTWAKEGMGEIERGPTASQTKLIKQISERESLVGVVV
jgi:hypothetical protein